MNPTTLVCTVGTSLFMPNLLRLDPERQYMLDPAADDLLGQTDKKALERSGLWANKDALRELLQGIAFDFKSKRWADLASKLTRLPPDLRLCGAEINSIEAMIRKKILGEQRQRLSLLVSDTEDGAALGTILSAYFRDPRCPIGFESCWFRTVKGLQDEKPLIFQREGLTNLVRMLGDELRKWGGEWIAINATGGYKAQIALAVAFGQATRCAVFYKHERFDQIIRFPRIPFTIDLAPVESQPKLWADLAEPGNLFTWDEMDRLLPSDMELRQSVESMMDPIDDGDTAYFALSALGMVYWEAYLTLHPESMLEPKSVTERNGCHFPPHHYPDGFKEYVEGVYNAYPSLISECHSIDHSGQGAIHGNLFYWRDHRLIGEYVDRNRFGGRFEIMTEARNELERRWVLNRLVSGSRQ